jgi:hypothetical protein
MASVGLACAQVWPSRELGNRTTMTIVDSRDPFRELDVSAVR